MSKQQKIPQKIPTDRLLVSGDSWMAHDSGWYREIFDHGTVTNLAVPGSGNRYIAESVMDHVIHHPDVDFVFVNWSGLNRLDFALPRGLPAGYQDPYSPQRQTWNSQYWTNNMAPWRDRAVSIQIDEPLTRMMYQEKGYRSVKAQNLLQVILLQDFLRCRGIPYLYCFLYDYVNADFDHNHLTGEALDHDGFSTLGSVDPEEPLLRQIDWDHCLTPSGLDWALRQDANMMQDSVHLTNTGYRLWAMELLRQYRARSTQ